MEGGIFSGMMNIWHTLVREVESEYVNIVRYLDCDTIIVYFSKVSSHVICEFVFI